MLKKILSTGVIALSLFVTAEAGAESTNMNSTATFSDGVTVGNEQNLDFGDIDFAVAPGPGDTVSLGTDGSIAYGGVFSGLGVGTVGSVDVTAGNNGLTVEVFCDQTATLTDGGGGSIDAVGIEVLAENGALGAYGAGLPCNGIAGAPATDLILNVGTLDTFIFGAQLDGGTAAGFAGGAYSTANAGGDNVQVDILYQ